MSHTLYPLQLVKFEDVDGKALGYYQAMKRKYKGDSAGDSIALGLCGGLIGLVTFAMIFAVVGVGSRMLIIFPFIASTAGSIFFLERQRRKGIKRILQDPEAKYMYILKQAVDAYNEQAAAFNKCLSMVGSELLEELRGFRGWMEAQGEELQKRIGLNPKNRLPELNTKCFRRSMQELREAEGQLALSSPERSALPQSTEYQEALAELEAEFPDSPEETE